jgi:hypothetical protein
LKFDQIFGSRFKIKFRIWISELFPKMKDKYSETNVGDSKTEFKKYMILYLEKYHEKKLNSWIDIIKEHDMSSAKYLVFLI